MRAARSSSTSATRVFAIWGAPIRRDDHATQACIAALALARAQEAERRERRAPVARLVTRIGVHTGPDARREPRLGAAIRLHRHRRRREPRLPHRRAEQGVRHARPGERRDDPRHRRPLRHAPLGRVRVVGRNEPVELHELIATRDETRRGRGESGSTHSQPLEPISRRGGSAEARGGIPGGVRNASGGKDQASAFSFESAERLAASPPPSWDGVIVFETKQASAKLPPHDQLEPDQIAPHRADLDVDESQGSASSRIVSSTMSVATFADSSARRPRPFPSA